MLEFLQSLLNEFGILPKFLKLISVARVFFSKGNNLKALIPKSEEDQEILKKTLPFLDELKKLNIIKDNPEISEGINNTEFFHQDGKLGLTLKKQ